VQGLKSNSIAAWFCTQWILNPLSLGNWLILLGRSGAVSQLCLIRGGLGSQEPVQSRCLLRGRVLLPWGVALRLAACGFAWRASRRTGGPGGRALGAYGRELGAAVRDRRPFIGTTVGLGIEPAWLSWSLAGFAAALCADTTPLLLDHIHTGLRSLSMYRLLRSNTFKYSLFRWSPGS
jgi:hypothetical protein